MELLPEDLRKSLPLLYSQEGNPDPIVHIKFFTPDGCWTWFVTEGSPEDDEFVFFGFVQGFAGEWGYFTLSELKAAHGPHGLPIERDLYFKPAPFNKIKKF